MIVSTPIPIPVCLKHFCILVGSTSLHAVVSQCTAVNTLIDFVTSVAVFTVSILTNAYCKNISLQCTLSPVVKF